MSSGCSSGVRCGAGYTRRMELTEAGASQGVGGWLSVLLLLLLLRSRLAPPP